MKVVVIGNGGRESAICWKLSKSKNVDKIYFIPGNGGERFIDKCENVNIELDANNGFDSLVSFLKENDVGLTVVGPEKPLVEGIVDILEKENLKVFGPNKNASKFEGSKIYARLFNKKYGVSIPEFRIIKDSVDSFEVVEDFTFPLVVKKDGLAAGKGVFICENEDNFDEILFKHFYDMSFMEKLEKDPDSVKNIYLNFKSDFLVEEFIKGYETSILVLIDKNYNYIPLISSMDYKKAKDNDKGLNTGGMGSIAPHPFLNEEVYNKFIENILKPTIKGMKSENLIYQGILYFGIIINNNTPYLLEYNVRFGDPETQSILPLLENDLLQLFLDTIEGRLDKVQLKWKNKHSCTVVLASEGYPENYEKGYEIKFDKGSETVEIDDSFIFIAGAKNKNNKLITDGGRVLAITSVDVSLEKARLKSYEFIKNVNFKNMYYRKDIGLLR